MEDVGAQAGLRVLVEAVGVPVEPVGVEVAGAVEVGDPDGNVVEVRYGRSLRDGAESLLTTRDDRTIILLNSDFLSLIQRID